MSIRVRNRLFILAAVLWVFPACHREQEASPPPIPTPVRPERAALGTNSWPVEVVDGLRRKVTLARAPQRIVSLAPSNTEILHAVGADPQVIGGTILDDYPPEARSRAKVGGMAPKSVNLEALVALRPDLVLTTSGVQESLVEPLERLGLTVVALDAADFADVARNIRTVGRLTGHAAEADRIAAQFLDRVAEVGRRAASRTSPRPKVLYIVREEPLTTAGPGTFIGRMIEVAGGINVFGDVTARFPRPSEEEVLARAPDVVLTSYGAMNVGGSDDEARRQSLRSRAGWGQIPAVRENRIAFLDENRITRAGPRLVEGLEAVAAILEAVRPESRAKAGLEEGGGPNPPALPSP